MGENASGTLSKPFVKELSNKIELTSADIDNLDAKVQNPKSCIGNVFNQAACISGFEHAIPARLCNHTEELLEAYGYGYKGTDCA